DEDERRASKWWPGPAPFHRLHDALRAGTSVRGLHGPGGRRALQPSGARGPPGPVRSGGTRSASAPLTGGAGGVRPDASRASAGERRDASFTGWIGSGTARPVAHWPASEAGPAPRSPEWRWFADPGGRIGRAHGLARISPG